MFTAMRITLRPGALHKFLKAEGISRDELAKRIGVNRATAYRVDEGMCDPSPKFIAGLVIVTGKKFEELFEIKQQDAA